MIRLETANHAQPTERVRVTKKYIHEVVKSGRWMIRFDHDGESYHGFRWNGIGEISRPSDGWDPKPNCGNGLHGQSATAGGYRSKGNRLVFCETAHEQVVIDGDKIKTPWARILMINTLPAGLKCEDLDLSECTSLTALPAGLKCEYLNLSECTSLTALPAGLKCEDLDLSGCSALTALPAGLKCETLNLSRCTSLMALPAGLKCEYLDLSECTSLTAYPRG